MGRKIQDADFNRVASAVKQNLLSLAAVRLLFLWQYAVDIVMPVGTPILAARAGVVMEMEDNFHGAAQKERYLPRSNYIRILHDDGTMAVYAHLEANSLKVREVQRSAAVNGSQAPAIPDTATARTCTS